MRDNLTAVAAAIALGAASFGAHASDVKVGGKMYFDLTDKTDKVGGVKTDKSGYGVDVPRFYLSVDGKVDDVWSLNITTDFDQDKDSTGASSRARPFVKKAFVQAKLDPLFTLRAGSADLPWIPFVENQYGFRYVEKTITDLQGFGTSADWGVHALGKSDFLDYAVSVVNGAGYGHVDGRSKRMDVEGRLAVTPFSGFTIAGGLYNGKLGKETESVDTEHTAERYDALVSYVGGGLRVGAEYFNAKNWKQVTAVPEDKSDGVSGWASYDITDIITVFGRYDSLKPSKDLNPDLKVKYYHAGVQYVAAKGISLALVYKGNKSDTGSSATEKKTNEVGVFGEFKF